MNFKSRRVESAPEELLSPGHSASGSNPRSRASSHPTTRKKWNPPRHEKSCVWFLSQVRGELRTQRTNTEPDRLALHSNQQQILLSSAGFLLYSGGFALGLHHQARRLPLARFENLQERWHSAQLSSAAQDKSTLTPARCDCLETGSKTDIRTWAGNCWRIQQNPKLAEFPSQANEVHLEQMKWLLRQERGTKASFTHWFFFLVFVFLLYFQSDIPQCTDCNKTTEVKKRSYWPDFGTADNPQGSATILLLHVSVSPKETGNFCNLQGIFSPATNLSINSRMRNKSGNHRSSKYAPRFQNVAPCCSLVIALVCTI